MVSTVAHRSTSSALLRMLLNSSNPFVIRLYAVPSTAAENLVREYLYKESSTLIRRTAPFFPQAVPGVPHETQRPTSD
jgi:hypothetical protein